MQVKKHKGRVYGGSMSAAEKKAAELEIRKQLAEYDLNNATEMDALVLYILHTEFGFGEKRLKRFCELFTSGVYELVDRYLMEDEKAVWLCTLKLEQAGFPVKQWHDEMTERIEAERGGCNAE